MAQDTTKLIIEIESILKGLDKTLRGLSQIQRALQQVGSGRNGIAQAVAKQAAIEQRAAESLQRQRSAALIAEERKRIAATETLQKQRNAALVAAQKQRDAFEDRAAKVRVIQQRAAARESEQIERANIRASESLQRQRSQALIRQSNEQQKAQARAQQELQRTAPQLDAHVRAFRAAEAATQAFNQKLVGVGNSLRSIGQGLSTIGATLSVALTAPLVALGVASVDAAVTLDSLKRGLTAIVGSSEEASRQLTRLTQIAKLPGIGFQEAIQGSIRLQAVGFSAREAEKALIQFSNAVALTGGGRDELQRVTVQLGQLAAKGKVLSQDLRPIIEAAPAVGRALLQAFGTVNAADIQELGLSSKEFLDTLVSQLGELPRAAAGAKNSFENFRDEIFRAAAAVGDSLLPALTRLAEAAGPIISGLASAFSAIPRPLQIVVIGFGALLAGVGPILFIVGQLTTGIGRLLVGFAQLNALGILPTIKNLKALTTGALTAAQAERTLASTGALVVAGIGGVLAILSAVVTAYAVYNALQKDTITLGREQVDALDDQIRGLQQQAKFLDGLKQGVARTADEQDRLLEIYEKLNVAGKVRVTSITDEERRLAALREEVAKLIALREQERVQQAASLTGQLANNLLRVQANENERNAIVARIQANTALIDTLQREQVISAASTRALAERGITASTVQDAIGALKTESENLSNSQDDLIKSGKELNDTAEDQAAIIQALQRQTGLTARQLLVAAQSLGVFRGDIEATLKTLERYTKETEDATRATDEFSRTLDQQASELSKAGEQADNEAKRRRGQISAAASLAREAASSFEDALKFLNAFITAQPGLRADIERERQIQGKSLSQFLEDALEGAFKGRAKSKAGTSLRNAQQELAKALADVALASSEQQLSIEQTKNDQLLQANESAQRLQLISYRQYLEARATLTAASLDLEITQQAAVAAAAKATQSRLLEAARKSGIPATERTKREAQAADANETAIKAEIKLADLQAKRQLITDALQQSIREGQKDQLKDIRQLEIEYAELTGRIEEAANAATDEKFRERLEQLGKAQKFINEEQEEARKKRDADRVAELEIDRLENQREIDAINNIRRQEDAVAGLAAANELVRRAKDRQTELERDLTFQVEFRGLTEEKAIEQRLAGERKLADSLRLSRDIVQSTIDALNAKGVKPPQALLDFIRETNDAVRGLGELPFSEQFRLAEKEFTRINDERLQKITDVERAVRNRDIAEVEGAIIIRRINGQYTADLEAQLVLLQQIADASKDRGLQRQAADAAETVKDTRDEVASLSKQIDAAGKDAFRSGLTEFFSDILNRTATAKDALLNLLNSVATAINNVIAENLGKELFESIFGGADKQAGGLINTVKRIFGFGGDKTAGVTQAADAAAATATLTTGAVAAATALTTGGAAAAATIATSVTASAAAFASAVIAAGAAFATVVSAGAGIQSIGGLGGALGAETGLFPAVPGGAYKFVEGGYPEAVLTTDPRHAARQVGILREFLSRTKGLSGRITGFEAGGMVSRETAEANLLSSIHRTAPLPMHVSDAAVAGGRSGDFTLRQILVDDQRDISNWYNSAEGDRIQVQWLQRNRPMIRKLLGVRD